MTSYDQIPYDTLSFPQTHPDRLATTARLFGIATPDVARCRVLELGCASGGNLIPMAANLPGAEFVGVDLSRGQVDAARSTIQALGLNNIDIRQQSIVDFEPTWGMFDYIICHGVFSWVERHVQDEILRIVREHLSPAGVAYISYNTYPGWHLRESVRHMMRYHAGRFDETGEQIEQARALLHFLASASDESGPFGQLLAREIERLSRTSDSYLFHEHLEQTNAPLYFHQFMERAEASGLQYLAEADVSDMLSSTFPADVKETLERISPDLLHLEQYMDFVRNRLFRQTLLCHRDVRPTRALTPAVLQGLMLSSRATTDPAPPDLTSMKTVVFQRGQQRAEVMLPASKAAFAVLMEAWPRAVPLDDLWARAHERAALFIGDAPLTEVRAAMMTDLFQAVMHGMIGLHTVQPSCTKIAGERPRAHSLAAYQIHASPIVVNAHHEMVRLEPLAVEVLKLANGERTRHEMLDVLVERVESGEIAVRGSGKASLAGEGLRETLDREMERSLQSLARNAVLAAS
jgi:methyltransferase-like protein/SAM-dependent methyltransferase